MNNEFSLDGLLYCVKSKSGKAYELRQKRFKKQYESGIEHPWDICAIAISLEQMHEMADKYWPNTDYTQVENQLDIAT